MRKQLLTAAVFCCIVCAAAYAADTIVTQSHTSFDSDAVTIKAGDTIVFANKDDVTHNVQVGNEDGEDDDKGLQKPSQDIRVIFAKAGVYKVHCSIHPKMKMTVTVQ
jgi:plastocyanin